MGIVGFSNPPWWGWVLLLAGYLAGVAVTALVAFIFAMPYRAERNAWKAQHDSIVTVNAGLLARQAEREPLRSLKGLPR